MLATVKFLTVGFLIVGFVGLAVADSSQSEEDETCTDRNEQDYRKWLKGHRVQIAKSKTPAYMDEIREAWYNCKVDELLNRHNLPSGPLPPSPKGKSPGSRKGSSSSGSRKGSSSSGSRKGSSSSGSRKGSSSSGSRKGSSSRHSKGS